MSPYNITGRKRPGLKTPESAYGALSAYGAFELVHAYLTQSPVSPKGVSPKSTVSILMTATPSGFVTFS